MILSTLEGDQIKKALHEVADIQAKVIIDSINAAYSKLPANMPKEQSDLVINQIIGSVMKGMTENTNEMEQQLKSAVTNISMEDIINGTEKWLWLPECWTEW